MCATISADRMLVIEILKIQEGYQIFKNALSMKAEVTKAHAPSPYNLFTIAQFGRNFSLGIYDVPIKYEHFFVLQNL